MEILSKSCLRAYCPKCNEQSCIHRNSYRRVPLDIGGLELCPRLVTNTDPKGPVSKLEQLFVPSENRFARVVLRKETNDGFLYLLDGASEYVGCETFELCGRDYND